MPTVNLNDLKDLTAMDELKKHQNVCKADWLTVFPGSILSLVPSGQAGVFLFLHFRSSSLIPNLEPLLLHNYKSCAYRFPLCEV